MNALLQLIDHGQSYWLDNLTRAMIRDGELERRVKEEGLRGVTSNPSIFSKAIAHGKHYEEQIEQLVKQGCSLSAIYEGLVVKDIQDACDILRPVYDDSEGVDGFVSLEVSPYLAHDTDGSIDEARRLFGAVDRPNVFIKIPGTREGAPAIEQLLAEGVNVNITLLFGIDAYEAVAEAYLKALERRVKDGQPIDRLTSVASFFLSRIDVLVDQLLSHRIRDGKMADGAARPERLLGTLATANAKLAYQRFKEIFSGERWAKLEKKGGRVQRMLWASTSTKNPLYRDVKYVEPLIGPHTVNTMPEQTIHAFGDHGRVADTVEEGLDEARARFDQLAEVGIDLDRVTAQLIEEGIQKFVDPFDQLLATLADARHEFLGAHAVDQRIGAGEVLGSLPDALDGLDECRFAMRMFAHDPHLWASSPEHVRVVSNRLGWLDAPTGFTERLEEITEFAAKVRDDGFTHVVDLGMGGSSLCPEVCARVFGSAKGWPALIVLDDTDPAAVRAVESEIKLGKTLFIVASKSGTTTETLSFYRYFYARVSEAVGAGEAGKQFIAITDPDTPLVEEAKKRKFRKVFLNAEDVGGRYSALTYFGLVPMALLGMDVEKLLAAARQMRCTCGPDVPAAQNPGLALGAALGLAARAGRDKVTFVLSPSIEAFGLWVEQLIAESTGKQGHGLVPIVGEALGEPGVYAADRVFVHLAVRGEADPAGTVEDQLHALEDAGHPVIRIELADTIGLGAAFLHWEIATAVAGAVIGVDAFDEPNVAESKKNTRDMLEEWKQEGKLPEGTPVVKEKKLAVYASFDGKGEAVGQYLDTFLGEAHGGDYVALLPYFRATDDRERVLETIRQHLRDRLHVATMLGYGPRYLHSTGQLHKGGPGSGVFILLTAEGDSDGDLDIPGESYGFATLHQAQALGDYQSLVNRKRRVVRIHLGDPKKGLDALADLLG